MASSSTPRSLATRRAVVRCCSPSNVARTMLCGLVEPRLLVRMSRTPAHSSTARTGPPAMTPVPDAAGFRSTRPAPWCPIISCGMVVPASGTSTRRRRAASTALRTASLTSFALPVAIPTRPCPSPTATSALKPKRRPPFTTFATRLMEITFSTSPSPSRCRSLESRRSPPRPPAPRRLHPRPHLHHLHHLRHFHHPEPRQGAPRAPVRHQRAPSPPAQSSRGLTARAVLGSPLELQSAFASAVGHRLHAPVILVTAAVEHNLGNALLLGLGGEQPSQPEAPGGLALTVDLEALGGVCGPDQCDAPPVVHDLRVDVLRGAEHDEPRALRATRDLAAHPKMPPVAAAGLRPDLMNGSHGLFGRLGGLAGLAPDLLAHVADPLAFVGLGWPDPADLCRHLAHELLVHALNLHEDVVVDRDLDPLRRVVRHGMGEPDDELHAERLRFRLVAHALDLERLREPLGHAVHHVGDERARESVERLVAALVGRPSYDDRLALHRHRQLGVNQPADFALRTLHGDAQPVELSGHALGHGDRLPADARHGSGLLTRPQRAARRRRGRCVLRGPS